MSFSLALVSIGMLTCTCTTTANLVKEIYKLSIFGSNLANMAYFLMYIPSNFLSIFVLGRFGVKISIVIGTLLFMLGAWLRLFLFFSGESFTVFYIGTFMAAAG
jgi:fucose permease